MIAPTFALTCPACASGSLVLARWANDRRYPMIEQTAELIEHGEER